MIFIWKKFLDTLDIPNIIFHESLHAIFKQHLEYNEKKEVYNGVTSMYLPTMATFLTFWKNTINDDDDSEIEIEEVLLAKIVSSGQNFSKSLNILSFKSKFSVAASTTKLAYSTPSSILVYVVMLESVCCLSSSEIFSFATIFE